MQGYILRVQKVRDEDCLVFILTENKLVKSYRFYGARHSIITQGFKLDFELEGGGVFLPHLRNSMHLGFKWLFQRERLLVWQHFMRLLYEHLKGVEEPGDFYYNLLDICAYKFEKQNPKRVVIEAYLQILDFEGRLHKDICCFLCNQKIKGELSLARGFLPSHISCLNKTKFLHQDIAELFSSKKCTHISDNDIDSLYYIVLEGL
ncbi:recombination protein RecO [Campylobacter hyointestinalis]|uniref:recombination protein RecO n=1 Tax=Campylobacter hyointestinalis TaxID=198 RepID=UPI000DCCABAB|nr:recombination protein RecO [Campylobacter hyointestinalis]RAZ49723.1 recombination protein RecO [Campylobacter hyointestinalis subsp. lawsonii]